MAVQAHHLNQFSSQQLLGNRDIFGSVHHPAMNLYSAHVNAFNSSLLPLSGTSTASDAPLLPAPYNSFIVDQQTPLKSDSAVSYNLPVASRKRSRDSIHYGPLLSYKNNTADNDGASPAFSFLGQDISLQIHRQQLDIDCLIANHMENVRVDLEERRKRQARRILEAIEVGMMKRLRAKEEEMAKIGKLNWALEEKVKSLCVENQIWRDLAQTNEATANALRTNLEQLLAQFRDERRFNDDDGATVVPVGGDLMDDAQSCCGSTGGGDADDLRDDGGNEGWRRLGGGGAKEEEGMGEGKRRRNGMMKMEGRLCRKCGEEESCVLMLPCRHLCLCTVCGSSLNTCPICKSFKTGTVHVNMS